MQSWPRPHRDRSRTERLRRGRGGVAQILPAGLSFGSGGGMAPATEMRTTGKAITSLRARMIEHMKLGGLAPTPQTSARFRRSQQTALPCPVGHRAENLRSRLTDTRGYPQAQALLDRTTPDRAVHPDPGRLALSVARRRSGWRCARHLCSGLGNESAHPFPGERIGALR